MPAPASSKRSLVQLLGELSALLESRRGQLIAGLLLAGAVLVAFWPAVDGSFLNVDDPKYVTQNPNVKLSGRAAILYAFTTFDNSNWHPLTWLSYNLDYQLWGTDPFGFHLTNLLLHVATVVLVFVVLAQLTRSPGRSLVVAALFGLHPLRVESVAWVAERKDVLFGFFWLLTMAAHGVWAKDRKLSSYALVVVFCAMALMSKSMAVTLPAALLLLDVWPLARWSRTAVLEKLPMFALAIGTGVLTILAQKGGQAINIDDIPWTGRVANAVYAYGAYVWHTIWPDLHFSYPHVALSDEIGTGSVVLAFIFFIGATGAALYWGRERRYLWVGWLWFLGTLVPAIGLLQVGRQGMADRYTYVPHLGLLILAVWGAAELPVWRTVRARAGAVVGVALILGVCVGLTREQARTWKDTITFWQYTVRKNPEAFMGHQTLASYHARSGRFDEAADALEAAAAIRGEFPWLWSRLGEYRLRAGQDERAAESFARALELEPDAASHHASLGFALSRLGRVEEARLAFARALELDPSDRRARYGMDQLPPPPEVAPDVAPEAPPDVSSVVTPEDAPGAASGAASAPAPEASPAPAARTSEE